VSIEQDAEASSQVVPQKLVNTGSSYSGAEFVGSGDV
jgi:hypothetical protein